MTREPVFLLLEGREYLYASAEPRGRRGHRYKIVRFVLDVPSYTKKVLVECLSGPDVGLLFVVTPANFATRYIDPDSLREPDPPPPEKVAGYKTKGRGA